MLREPRNRVGILVLWAVVMCCVVAGSLLPAASQVIVDIGRLHVSDKVLHFCAYLALSSMPVIGFRDRLPGSATGDRGRALDVCSRTAPRRRPAFLAWPHCGTWGRDRQRCRCRLRCTDGLSVPRADRCSVRRTNFARRRGGPRWARRTPFSVRPFGVVSRWPSRLLPGRGPNADPRAVFQDAQADRSYLRSRPSPLP
jgi:hypothetical protein